LLCRMAPGGHLIDPVSFTTIRLVSGTLALILIIRLLGEFINHNKQRAHGVQV
jgi:hypothetical protein